ncbi:MAG TPA: carbamoyltransferase C-terminal domain-containing protein [Noviherbaspirillum sp.]|uniref:carbamoyltransferase family protein n=1 Tax=Noviherbaspirillum sp. TaxID=1926288 RepID=UPI002B485B41|nr:carbamoyltransferase C-terminal domain-containing protein [Noviherbaspirillum sp.]HJV86396.1 carbamoyltransferase C-terminal domain-containing protein [Noviherbaspirillum sp.]
MSDAPRILGINRTQDASICLMQGSHLAWAIQKERLTRQKHHWGRLGDLRDIYVPRLPGLDQPLDVLVECYSSDAEIDKLADYEKELSETLRLSPGCRRARISHHLAHLYSVFHPSPFDEAAVMIIDGQGSPMSELTEQWSGAASVPGDWREISSFYCADRRHVECIDKQLWDRNEERLVGLGMFYFLLTHAIFPGQGNEGKVMGLAPHGDPDALGLPPLEVNGAQVTIPARWFEILHERGRFRYVNGSSDDKARFADIANLAAAGQRAFEEAVLEVARWLHAQTGVENLCFAGGTGLNCSTNDRLLRETPFRRVFIPPAPSDAGTALGCAIYGITELLGQPCAWRWENDYLGPQPRMTDIEAALQGADDLIVERIDRQEELCARVVDLLCATKVVALYQGGSEFGPRALGHRSILGDPRHGHVRDWINAKVKEREWFRPLAPIVLLERAEEFFDIFRPSPFMQFAAPVRPQAAQIIPAVTHVDCTARLQTVSEQDDPLLRALLQAFEARTGVPVLLNTSFNRKEEPIVETPAEALESFRRTPMHALAMPPFLVRKRVEPEAVS